MADSTDSHGEGGGLAVAVAGASGRMGRALIEAVLRANDLQLVGALEAENSPSIGRDAAEVFGKSSGICIESNIGSALRNAEVLIDFTRPEGTLRHLAACSARGINAVVGTTGLDAAHYAALRTAAQTVGIVFASNMSIGVNVAYKLMEVAATILDKNYDIEIIETHHRYKVDAPSGTAITMGKLIAAVTNRDLGKVAVYGREGIVGERHSSAIGFSSIRGGDVVGDHTVLFAGIGERLEITHKASSRATYAEGALQAARFIHGKTTGVYDMQDVLGLK